ncbi:hypothetical protein Egran_02962 [Elaphomyces granulatus]|uniref:5'-3' exoribonuclease 1 n=1 Tax=Elaphomyces granulatus TaxID=519963 RepID=A0A232LYX4_9EURO|nr:hypothetical protein Egran_02962 [Elaphomyces granulatus]
MGVPKFFRWLSERYPAISQLIAENRIPEFDCLYLDMNGIIHNCTHKDSDSPTFRMTEDKMFIAIFNYIEHLYGKIKPKRLFFMAIDGVAPRAKMNQQRARRFRTAFDAEVAIEKAIRSGVEMPNEDFFDSNCITPGTEFMARLTQHLKYFINKKISEDVDWQGVEIVLSGHEVPGEGEHKIMEYIRQAKAQPGYDPNVRHCLYGLDADLIMLGLLSHDPHFCLLREEVTFGRQNQKKTKELEYQNFYLLHLCVVREYLELEFQDLKTQESLGVAFDMEGIIDDFILMAFFVGNDFLPNLPNLHINEDALAVMFGTYKESLPKMGGYINERGVINLERLGILLDSLRDIESRSFEGEYSDERWIRSKKIGVDKSLELVEKPKEFTITPSQKQLLKEIGKYVLNRPGNVKRTNSLDLPPTLPARDRKFVQQLADDLHLLWTTISDEHGDRFLRLQLPGSCNDGEEGGEGEDEDEEEAFRAVSRVIRKYEKAKVRELSAQDAQASAEETYERKFQEWKNGYYEKKFGWGLDNEEEIRKLTENYVQGLQWVLYYYYRGIVSWPWFFGYHYAPMISDVKRGLKANMDFNLGQPFKPFQQLMGVLPDRSKQIVPSAYHPLMTSPESPIIDFYPRDFELDMNGKKMEWEAVVKIPFIDENRLLAAMSTKDHLLSASEQARNGFGVSLKFTYSPSIEFTYLSSLPGIFPDIPNCHCIENIFDLPTMDGLEPFIGLVDGVKLGESALAGFPSLKTLPHAGQLGFHGVSIFQQDSRNESMIITILDPETRSNAELAKAKLGQRVFVGYPFLQEALVVRVSDELFDYVLPEGELHINSIPHSPVEIDKWKNKADRIEGYYSKRLGMIIGPVELMVHVQMLKGLKKSDEGATFKEFAEIPGQETDYAFQLVVNEVVSEDERFIEKEAVPIEEELPEGSRAFFLGEFNYGRPVHVIGHEHGKVNGLIASVKGKEPDFGKQHARNAESLSPYTPSFAVARNLQLIPLVLAKITSSFSVVVHGQRVNLGLNLKFESRKQKVLGYSRRGNIGWEFSQKAIELIQEYMIQFPEFFAGIQNNPQGDRYEPTDFYPKETALKKIKEIEKWLKSIEAKNFERVPLDAEQLDSDVVMLIELDSNRLFQSQQQVEPQKIKGVPRVALLKPSDAEKRLGNQKFTLGDRVVYAQDSGKVPIATRGTVVGLTRTPRTVLLDVVFDFSFMSGTTLGDRCSPFRGSTVPVSSVLNLTDRQLVVSTRAATDQQTQKQTLNPMARGYDPPLGPGGRGQLRHAQTPPPLRGTVTAHQSPNTHGSVTRGQRGSRGFSNGVSNSLPVRPHPTNGAQQNNYSGFRGGRGRSASVNGHRGNHGGQVAGRNGYVAKNITHSSDMGSRNYTFVPPPASLILGNGRVGRVNGGSRGAGRGSGRGSGSSD